MKYLLIIVILVVGFGLGWFANNGSKENLPSLSPTASPSATPAATNPLDPNDYVRLDKPVDGQKVSSPLRIKGQAKGTYFFEGSFPIVLTDWDGKIIAESFATAKEEWMTEEYVPFEATLEFETPSYGDRGSLILQRDNPSGLPENDAAYEIRIFFEKN